MTEDVQVAKSNSMPPTITPPTGPPGPEWMIKLQACDELRDEQLLAARKVLMHIEEVSPFALDVEATQRCKLVSKIQSEIGFCTQSLGRNALKEIAKDWEELQVLRKSSTEVEERVARMNGNYLREISAARNRLRQGLDTVTSIMQEVDKASSIAFYEPLQYLSPEVRRTVMGVIDEKLKAMFDYDPTLREKVNNQELARFEDSMLRDRCEALDRLNETLRGEVRDFRNRLKKMQMEHERDHGTGIELRREKVRLEGDLAAACKERDAALKTAYQACKRDQLAEADSSASTASVTQAALEPRSSATSQPVTVNAAVQTQRSRQEDFMPDLGSDSLERDEDKEALMEKVHHTNHELGLSRTLLRKRESELTKLKAELAASQFEIKQLKEAHPGSATSSPSCASSMDALVEPAAQDPEQLRSQLLAARQNELAAVAEAARLRQDCERSHSDSEKLQKAVQDVQDEVSSLQAALQVSADMRKRLQEELSLAKEQAAKAEKQRKQQILEAATPGTASIAAELEAEMHDNADLRGELESLQAAVRLLVSRNDALSAALAAAGGTEPVDATVAGTAVLPGSAQMRAAGRTHQEVALLQDQREALRERTQAQKAQLQMVVRENQVMQMALDGMQHDIQVLLKQLRRYMPSTEVISEDLEAVLCKFDKVAKNGGGAYVRLNKEARLREVAAELKRVPEAKKEAEKREAALAEPEGKTATFGDLNQAETPSPRRSATQPIVRPTPPPRALQTPATTVCFPSVSTTASTVEEGRPSHPGVDKPHTPKAHTSGEASPTSPKASGRPRKASLLHQASLLPQAPQEKRGSVSSSAFGMRGGMAILGSTRFRGSAGG